MLNVFLWIVLYFDNWRTFSGEAKFCCQQCPVREANYADKSQGGRRETGYHTRCYSSSFWLRSSKAGEGGSTSNTACVSDPESRNGFVCIQLRCGSCVVPRDLFSVTYRPAVSAHLSAFFHVLLQTLFLILTLIFHWQLWLVRRSSSPLRKWSTALN